MPNFFGVDETLICPGVNSARSKGSVLDRLIKCAKVVCFQNNKSFFASGRYVFPDVSDLQLTFCV